MLALRLERVNLIPRLGLWFDADTGYNAKRGRLWHVAIAGKVGENLMCREEGGH